MSKTIGTYEIILTGSLIIIKNNGETFKAIDTNPLHSIQKFNEIAGKIAKLA